MTYIEHLLHAAAFRCIVLHPVLPGACEVSGEELAFPGSRGREEAKQTLGPSFRPNI